MKKLYVVFFTIIIFSSQLMIASETKRLKTADEFAEYENQIREERIIRDQLFQQYDTLLLLDDIESERVLFEAIAGVREIITYIEQNAVSVNALKNQLRNYQSTLKITLEWKEQNQNAEGFSLEKRNFLDAFIANLISAIEIIEEKME